MAYEDMRLPSAPNNISVEGRERIAVSGVTEVETFNEQQVVMGTTLGRLTVHGDGLHVEKLSVDSGDVLIFGRMDSLEYEDGGKETGGFFSRLFR